MNKEEYDDDLRQAVKTLRGGGVILYPTDTVWGVGCDATNADAVARVYAIKRREEGKSMLVLVDSADRASTYAGGIPDVAFSMMDLATAPLTLILDGAKNLAPNLIGPDGTIGLRVTAERFSRDLCYRLGRPVVSTSANVSGRPAAAIFDDVDPEIVAAVDYAVRYRRDDRSKARPSSIVKIGADGQVKIIRP